MRKSIYQKAFEACPRKKRFYFFGEEVVLVKEFEEVLSHKRIKKLYPFKPDWNPHKEVEGEVILEASHVS